MGGTLDHRLAGTALAYEIPLCRYMAQPGRIICNVFFNRITRGEKRLESAARATALREQQGAHGAMAVEPAVPGAAAAAAPALTQRPKKRRRIAPVLVAQ